MSKLKRHKKYHPPFDDSFPNEDQDTCKSKHIISNLTKTYASKTSKEPIFQRAIASAQKHGIKLEAGRENGGNGNCSYESVIYNINERNCFKEKLPMSSDYYRRIWNTDMMNKLLDRRIPWNPGLSRAELMEGFNRLNETGVYEIPYFGDMMMAGIACGVRKRILIFNTNERTGHDPVAVIDPTQYAGYVDSEIPVVVAYNMVHFESLHTIGREDIEETIKLTKSYIAQPSRYQQEYGFTNKDMKYLVTEMPYNQRVQQSNVIKPHTESIVVPDTESTQGQIADVTHDEWRKEPQMKRTEVKKAEAKIDTQNPKSEMFKFEGFCFKEQENGLIKCGICDAECKTLMNHLNKCSKCNRFLNMEKFKTEYTKYKARQRKKTQRDKQKNEDLAKFRDNARKELRKYEAKMKAENEEQFRNNANKRLKQHETKKKAENAELFRDNANKRLKQHETKKKAENAELFRNDANKRLKQHETKKKAENAELFRDNANKRLKQHETKKKAENAELFRDNANKRLKQHRTKKKAENAELFRDNANKRLKQHETKKKAENAELFRANANKRLKQHETKKKAENAGLFRDNANKRLKQHETKKKAQDADQFKENIRQRKAKFDNSVTAKKRVDGFRKKVQFGPIFVCSCCHQKLFENQVDEFTDTLKDEIDKTNSEIRSKCIGEDILIDLGRDDGLIFGYICKSCKRSLKNGKMPKLCVRNGLEVDEIEEDMKLTDLENNLIARNIIFQKVHKLPKSRWSGTHDRLINVPVQPQDVLNTIENLPRTPAEAGLIPIIPVSLKRKLEYKTSHLVQMIDTNKIFKYLDFLSKSGHPSYKFYDDWNTYEKRCLGEDPAGAKLVFPEHEQDIVDLEAYINQIRDTEVDENNKDGSLQVEEEKEKEKDEEEYREKDPIRKYQFDYNKTTCMTNKYPEANFESALSFAPAEGKLPTNILKDENWDIDSFPNLHPSGRNRMFQEREVKLTSQQYLTQRLKNKDTRFEQCTPYVFASAAYLEERQMERNIGISFQKGKLNITNEGSKSYKLEDAFAVLDDIKSTPKYWKKAKMEMLAKIDNFGPFHWFYTLSCADMRWDENFSSILLEKGFKIIWSNASDKSHDRFNQDDFENITVKVEYQKESEIKQDYLRDFLEHECEDSLHEAIRTNVFIATRNFVQRVKAFRTEILMGKNNPDCITYWSDKMEFQGRGAGHIHGVAWCDLKKVSELIEKEKDVGVILRHRDVDNTENNSNSSHLENAYRKLREINPLGEEEENALIDFVDRSVTCTLNPDLAAKMIDPKYGKEIGKKIIRIVEECLTHHHTKACRKNGISSTCRFRFPKFPVWQTILTRSSLDEADPDERQKKDEEQKKILLSVMQVLEDTEKINEIMKKYDKENESIQEYRCNRKKRILEVLELAHVDPEEYITALKENSRKGVNVILARDIDELYVNNYDPEWVLAWDGNIDKQPCFDFFAVITYITEYFTKDESGTSAFLAQASKQIKGTEIKNQKRCIKNVFLTHRQMGLSEAFMKIFPEMKLKDSNIGSIFLPLGKREDVSRYLLRADPNLDYQDKELIKIDDREGMYYEKPNWIEKYLRRNLSEWDELCLPQYVKMFDPTNKDCQEIEETDGIYDNADEPEKDTSHGMQDNIAQTSKFDKDKLKYGQEVKFHYLIKGNGELGKALPSFMKMENPFPGEPKLLRKRRHPKALRFYKVKRELNPSRFFLHELMMYKSFTKEDYDRWHDDKICQEDYMKYKDIIQNVKSKVMEWIEDVEEARYFVEEVMKNEVEIKEIGEEIDAEKHKEDVECELEGQEEDEEYQHLNTDGLKGHDFPDVGNWHRKLEVLDSHSLEKKTRRLDVWQRKIVDIALNYSRSLKMFSNRCGSLPRPRNLIVIGGAGAGKSTVIECLTQWAHRTLTKDGDDPNSPYILKAATTGAASTLIEGTTVHSCLGFDHSNKHSSLTDKKREQKKEQLKNLKILIIDEFSMMKSDILYRIHLRLCEVTQVNRNFGGVNVYLFGDPAQLKPVRGRYIFDAPNCPDYKLAYGDGSESLWRSFEVINLEENHRQGKDKDYADMLNRVRMGKQTAEDIETLKSRVRPKNHGDLKGALFISAKVKPVAIFNEKSINKLPGKLYTSKAIHIQSMSKSFKPKVDKVSGRIGDTHFIDEFCLKIGARVMLIFNIDVADLLCNGATGTVCGVEGEKNGNLNAVIVTFDHPDAGKESRRRNPGMASKYPYGTVIKKIEQDYSLAKMQGLVSSTAKLIQFPLVLAWAVTVHKFQGSTVRHPQKVVVDMRSVFEAAQAYVMLSRVQELNQIYILEELPQEKIYASQAAIHEIERLQSISLNMNPTYWEENDDSKIKICFLNCRSIKNKFENVTADKCLLMGRVLFFVETWLEPEDDGDYQLPDFCANFSNRGRGKGIATFYKSDFQHKINVNYHGFSISKLESDDMILLGVYRSNEGSMVSIFDEIEDLIAEDKLCVIGGDLNINLLKQPKNFLISKMKEKGFEQYVRKPTHTEGGLIDHIYIRQGNKKEFSWALEQFPKYYSDHDGLGVIFWKV